MVWQTDELQKSRDVHPWDRSEPGVCPNCDARNDPAFTFCRNCIQRLPSARDSDSSRLTPDQ